MLLPIVVQIFRLPLFILLLDSLSCKCMFLSCTSFSLSCEFVVTMTSLLLFSGRLVLSSAISSSNHYIEALFISVTSFLTSSTSVLNIMISVSTAFTYLTLDDVHLFHWSL